MRQQGCACILRKIHKLIPLNTSCGDNIGYVPDKRHSSAVPAVAIDILTRDVCSACCAKSFQHDLHGTCIVLSCALANQTCWNVCIKSLLKTLPVNGMAAFQCADFLYRIKKDFRTNWAWVLHVVPDTVVIFLHPSSVSTFARLHNDHCTATATQCDSAGKSFPD